MKTAVTQRQNLEQMQQSLEVAATVFPVESENPQGVKRFKYWVGRNLEIVRRERERTRLLQKAELRPIPGWQEYEQARFAIALKYGKRDARGNPIQVEQPDGSPGVEIEEAHRTKCTAEIAAFDHQHRALLRTAHADAQRALAVEGRDVSLEVFSIPFADVPERLAGGITADLRFMLEGAPEAQKPLGTFSKERYFGAQPAAPRARWYNRLWPFIKKEVDGH